MIKIISNFKDWVFKSGSFHPPPPPAHAQIFNIKKKKKWREGRICENKCFFKRLN